MAMTKAFFRTNRANFFKQLPEGCSGFFCSTPAFRDWNHPFFFPMLDRNYFYLTGLEGEHQFLLLRKHAGKEEAVLYSDEPVEEGYGFADIRPTEAFDRDFEEELHSCKSYGFFTDEGIPFPIFDTVTQLKAKAAALVPGKECVNLFPIMYSLRSIKQPEEILCMREAISLTGKALAYTARRIKPDDYEYQALAHFNYRVALGGQTVSFEMAASGVHAAVLHYMRSDGRIGNGETLLFDLGSYANNYSSDISRAYPANGKFTPRQRTVYELVLEAQQVALEKVHVGVNYTEVNDAVIDFYAKELRALGLIRNRDEVGRYYYHRVGHTLGLGVHDLRLKEDIVAENSIYTIEPGLYIEEEGIGIRIEDNYLVSSSGVENLSREIPKRVDEIEALMASGPVLFTE